MRIPSEVKCILFDWGDTLVRPPGFTTDKAGHLACVEALYQDLQADSAFAAELECARIDWPKLWDSYSRVVLQQIATTGETGREHTFEDRFALTFEVAGLGRPLMTDERHEMARRLGERIAAACRPIGGVGAAVRRLGTRYAVGLLSNYPFPPVVRSTVESLDCSFSPFVISGECGWAKPHGNAFAACLSSLPYSPEQILYVGDDPVNDIEGASTFGFRTCWIERKDPAPAPEITSLRITSVCDLVGMMP